eukprot:scaffold87119_cov25-Phaeocystis_antarctica.AAC.1
MKRERRARASPRCTQHEIASAVITTQRVWQSVHSATAGVRGEQGAKPSRIQHERYIRGEQGGRAPLHSARTSIGCHHDSACVAVGP